MKVGFRRSFLKDLERIRDQSVRRQVREAIEAVERAASLQEIEHLKKLRGGDRHYRIKVGDFRLGLILEEDTLTFVRFLHRKDIYRYFP